MHFVYILRCADGTLDTGYARDPKARLKMHNAGAGAKYTRGRRPVKLVYTELCESLSHALKREYELKQWPLAKKRQLVGKAARSRQRRRISMSSVERPVRSPAETK